MKAFARSIIIMAVAVFIGGSCDTKEVTPSTDSRCIKGVLVERVSNCFLVIQVLNAPIGKSFTYKRPSPSTDPSKTYTNAVMTTTAIRNVNFLDTIYFKYDKQVKFDCNNGNGIANPDFWVPDVPAIRVLSYSNTQCQ